LILGRSCTCVMFAMSRHYVCVGNFLELGHVSLCWTPFLSTESFVNESVLDSMLLNSWTELWESLLTTASSSKRATFNWSSCETALLSKFEQTLDNFQWSFSDLSEHGQSSAEFSAKTLTATLQLIWTNFKFWLNFDETKI
jgi:hypothetical protein